MLRCPDGPAGRYRVEFDYLETDGSVRKEEYLADIGPHQPVYAEVDGKRTLAEDMPRASQKHAYEGELCQHELAWLRHLPGKTYSAHRRYIVKEIK